MNITNLNSLEQISKNFNININFLEYMLNQKYNVLRDVDLKVTSLLKTESHHYTNMSNYICIKKIPKRNKKNKGQFREVLEIKSPYNIFYKELLHEIEHTIEENNEKYILECAHGFIKGKNTLSNAKKHLNKKYILKLDIFNFFNSIKLNSIYDVFIKLGCNDESAKLFSSLCTYNNELKEGLNTSPILANLFCYELDKDLMALSKEYNLTYTRYGDDLTFSSDYYTFPSINDINDILKKYHLRLNSNKTVAVKKGQSQYVTGLSISNDLYPRVPRRIKRKIRQDLYQLNKYFYDDKTELEYKLRQVYGKIVYTLGIEEILGTKYKKEFINILNKYDYELSDIFEDAPTKLSNQVFHYMDESEVKINNKHYIALSVVSVFSEEIKNSNRNKIYELKDELVSDFRNGLTDEQKSNLFHYCEDNMYVKGKYQDLLRKLDFETFIIFIPGESTNMKKAEYQKYFYKAFGKIFYIILRRFKQYNNYIYPEVNSKIKKNKLEETLSTLKGLPSYTINVETKNELLLTIPDYTLGVFRDCIKKDLSDNIKKLKGNQTLHEENKINEILDKIRLIIDAENNIYYSRKKSNKLNCIKLNELMFSNMHDESDIDKTIPIKTDKLSFRTKTYRKIKRFISKVKQEILKHIK